MCSLIAYKWSRYGLVTLGLDRHRRIDVSRGRRHRAIAARKFCLRQGRLAKERSWCERACTHGASRSSVPSSLFRSCVECSPPRRLRTTSRRLARRESGWLANFNSTVTSRKCNYIALARDCLARTNEGTNEFLPKESAIPYVRTRTNGEPHVA